MSKIAVVYWSGTGNTEAMATAIADGAKAQGAHVSIFTAGEFVGKNLDEFTALALGCPAMGAEVLEEGEFQPMWDEIKDKLSGKNIGLFGSYGWGTGEWMATWKAEAEELGAKLVVPPVIGNNAPDDGVLANCQALGVALAAV